MRSFISPFVFTYRFVALAPSFDPPHRSLFQGLPPHPHSPSTYTMATAPPLINTLVLLRVAPLVTATCTLVFGNVQHFFLATLNQPANKTPSRALPPRYWAAFFRRGVATAVGLLAATIATSLANLYYHEGARGAGGAYGAGAALAVAHFAFAPLILPRGVSLATNETRDGVDLFDVLDRWLWAQTLQMWTVDLGAWLALAVAVGRALEA